MKRLLLLFFILVSMQTTFATEWLWYCVYVQTDYVQGPWTRTDVLGRSGSYVYLHPKFHEELFGSEKIDFANAVFTHLKKENPKRYAFKSALALFLDTVVIETKEAITDFDAVKNELTASFTLNSFKAVKIIQKDKSGLYTLKDVSVPYMDLVPSYSDTAAIPQIIPAKDSVKKDSVPVITPVIAEGSAENSDYSSWLIVSVAVNLLLLALLIRKKSGKR